MKGGKNKNSGLLSDTETSPPWDAVTDVYSEKKRPLEVEEKEREGGDKEEKVAGDEENDEDAEIQPDELELAADDEKPKLAEGFYEIETVRRKRIRKGEIQYLIKWRGWPETANTWEPVDNLMTCYDVIDAFEDSLQSGKQRSTRKRKRTHGVNHSQIKTKQQQKKQHKQEEHSPADATYNVPAVKLRIIEEPVPSPPLASLNVIDHVDRNGSGLNNFQVDQVANDNDLMLDPSVKEIEEQNELHLKLNELKGVMATIEASVEKGVIKTKEASVENGVMATKESSVENGVMAMKEASVDKGVVTTKEASVENRRMATKEASVDKGVVTTKEASVENGLMATKEASVDKGVLATKVASVENSLMATKEASVDKGVLATKEASVENGLMATKEASVDKGVMATKEASVEKGVMATEETYVEEGVMAIKEVSVERGVMATEETYVEEGVMATRETSVDRRFSTANGTESVQSGRHTGAKRRKSASVRRFKQQATSGVEKDLQDAVANATSGHLVAFMQEEIHDHGLVGNVLGCNNKCDQLKDTYAITEIIKAESYSPPNIENGLKDVSVTFLAKRSDGKEVIVDNKFMKTNNPLLLISYYEKHLRHHPSQ